ncbi:biliverdin-producing heme oxygenase [Vreelandella neptunia]|uniref:biliverdin-producing heme oxygenase n=1 Tax=Vreelandella neptunia TaxID=115551 RepID=UPI003159BE65
MSKPTLSEWLKRETRADHHRVDQHPALKPLLRRELTVAEYTSALSALYAPIASLEQALSSGLQAHDMDYRLIHREALLKADIHQLGRRAPSAPLTPPPTSVADAVGMLYVLEGSRLGGKMIALHVDSVLDDQVPLRFFTAHPLTTEEWAAFWHFAEYHCPRSTWPAVLAGAQQAFGHFTQGLATFASSGPVPRE